jgi:signal transduction histidine kinase
MKNATEACTAAGTIPHIRVGGSIEDSTAQLVIADNGPGIAPADLPRIFDVGYSTKAASRGRGLAIVRESVQVQGGSIAVSSRPGEGTEFRIELPLAASATAL